MAPKHRGAWSRGGWHQNMAPNHWQEGSWSSGRRGCGANTWAGGTAPKHWQEGAWSIDGYRSSGQSDAGSGAISQAADPLSQPLSQSVGKNSQPDPLTQPLSQPFLQSVSKEPLAAGHGAMPQTAEPLTYGNIVQ